MITDTFRKVRQVAADPVLRRWLVRRLTGGESPPPPFTSHCPPYLADLPTPGPATPDPPTAFRPLAAPPPTAPIELPLPGGRLMLEPGGEKAVFAPVYRDIETLLALHRFAWLPLVDAGDTAAWAQAMWDEWRRDFAEPGDGWAWHAYTAAERAINLLDFAERSGLPGPVDETVDLLACHATAINARLEYFGDHNTSNHLSNNGRGLYRIGLALGLAWAAERGARILLEEAKRLFLPSGVLREGSSHYHLLLARNYADAWLAARTHARLEEPELRAIVRRALAVAPRLMLPGGLPLIGDISPDCPPEHLLGLTGTGTGWVARLSEERRRVLGAMIDESRYVEPKTLLADGWLRFDHGPWAGIWHIAPMGWPPMPGHGHQDTGGFEVHFDGGPVFVDPGRGAYGETGEAAQYRSGRVHNTVLVDGHDPFPPNKPYYEDSFRQRVTGEPPVISGEMGSGEVAVSHGGFRRLTGVGALHRRWCFAERGMTIEDRVDGVGRRRLTRILVTPMTPEVAARGVVLKDGERVFRLSAGGDPVRVEPMTLWHAYGEGQPGNALVIEVEARLPWSGVIYLETV